jgi:sec-independent protein translocase protein TatB
VFGISGAEFVVLLVVAVIIIGPERLPRYAEQLGGFVRSARGYLRDAKARVDAEIGDEIGDVDWSKLDPRQYDPRRIVREALLDDDPAPTRVQPPPPPAPTVPSGPAPFDDEAT